MQAQEIAARLWPEHAEVCSPNDWEVILNAAQSDREPEEVFLQNRATAEDRILASLMILYWTMRVVQLALEIAREVRDLKGAEKLRAILDGLLRRVDPSTPRQVRDRLSEIAEEVTSAPSDGG